MQQKKIIFLAADCESSRWVYNALEKDFAFEGIMLEQPVSKKTLIENRIKKIGVMPVIGQILFTVMVVPILKWKANKRKIALIDQYQLDSKLFDERKIIRVGSVNKDACLGAIKTLNPDIIIVNGTRIISKKILESTNAIFINMHVGITPQYRGSHGGYWAMRNKDESNFGTTIHLIDTGIDTGAVIKQVFAKPEMEDNFTTYPVLQTAIGIATLKELLPQIISGNYDVTINKEKGKMYYQPTIWQYFFG